MKLLTFIFVTFSINIFAMRGPYFRQVPQKEYSIQDLLNSKPNYCLCTDSACDLSSSINALTSVVGIENVEGIRTKHLIILDHNLIRLQGSPFEGKRLRCRALSLNSNQITAFNPTFFAGLKHLRVLELKYNEIEELKVEDLKALSKLTKLMLFGNPLSEDNKDEIVVKFPDLEVLF